MTRLFRALIITCMMLLLVLSVATAQPSRSNAAIAPVQADHSVLFAQQPTANRPTVADFQRRIDEYGELWTMTDGTIDLTTIDRFYAPDADIIIIDIVPPGISRGWVTHRQALERETFSNLIENRFVPRQDVTLKLLGDNAAITTFTFDYENQAKDGQQVKLTGRQTNVWEQRGNNWVIVHEHGSPVPFSSGNPSTSN